MNLTDFGGALQVSFSAHNHIDRKRATDHIIHVSNSYLYIHIMYI